MRPFFWKITICILPVLASLALTWHAYVNDRFKLGVDLSGGTILVYEIDIRKMRDQAGDGKENVFNPVRDTNLLADSLKRRIDPTATYNIVIRPAGGEGRVEIILPTGGEERAREADKNWRDLLAAMEKQWPVGKLEVPRGRKQELIDQIVRDSALAKWKESIFKDQAAWNTLVDQAFTKWVFLKDEPNVKASDTAEKRIRSIAKGETVALSRQIADEIEAVRKPGSRAVTSKEVEAWVKDYAWKELIQRCVANWPNELKLYEKQMEETIPPDSFNELVGRIESKGNVVGQGTLRTVELVLGKDIHVPGTIDRHKITDFIHKNYGPTREQVQESIKKSERETGYTKDITVEEVQRIKDLVAKVGSLEFRILANNTDDTEAIKDARADFEKADFQIELKKAAERGEPPPAPREGSGRDSVLKKYPLKLPNDNKSIVSYSWAELGPQERLQLGLDNASQYASEKSRREIWIQMNAALGKAVPLKVMSLTDSNKYLLQGALFYARECVNRDLTVEQQRAKKYEYFVLARNPEYDPVTGKQTPKIDGSYLAYAQSEIREGRPVVSFVFKTAGGELFGTLTRKNKPSGAGTEESQIRRHLAIILDGQVMSAPTINSEIRTHGQISGSFTKKEVDALVNILRAGALPATLKPQPVSESTIGATLGSDTVRLGVNSIVWAFVAVVVFMLVYYRFAGLVACLALFANLILTVGFMVGVSATFTLAGLAGLVLMLGMAVDANVLIYERLREERDRGASLLLAIRNGYERALPTIIDTHLSSIFTAIVLYVVGNDALKGFGVSLTVGLIISLFTSLYQTHVMFDLWLSKGWLKKLSMLRLLSNPRLDFMRVRMYWFTITGVLTVLGFVLFIARLPNNLNIDFTGGTAYGGQLVPGKAQDVEGLRLLFSEGHQGKHLKAIDAKETPESDGREFTLIYEEPNGSKAERKVFLANKPEFTTPADREQDVKKRARELPDVSVEQLFPSNEAGKEKDPSKSRYFTVRTSEKETELVQAAVDRLLREPSKDGKWDSLLQKHIMHFKPQRDFSYKLKEATLSFAEKDKDDPAAKGAVATNDDREFASPSFVKTLFTRELLRIYKVEDRTKLPFGFEVNGEGVGHDGRFRTMKVGFTNDLTQEDAAKVSTALVNTRNAFNDRPQPERLDNFDSELAGETRMRAMWAILASWIAILLYLWFRFGNWTFGLAAVLCLVHDLFFTLGIITVCHYLHGTFFASILQLEDFKIDLAAVAALLTLVGYSVADTIVVFDRIRETRGKNPDLTPAMINDSVNGTLSRTLLTSGITWLVVVVLYLFGGPGVHLFAFVMVVGVIVGTYSSIYVASPLLLIFGEGEHEEKHKARGTQAAVAEA